MTLASGAGGVVSYAGAPLDGEWVNAADAYPSGDGTPGGDFLFRFNVLVGDVVGDGIVNALDVAAVKQRLTRRPGDGVVDPRRSYSVFADVNTDAVINALDVAAVKARLTRRLPAAQPSAAQPAAAAASQPPAAATPGGVGAAALAVESVCGDVLAHRVRREVADRQAGGDPLADERG
jgi:hypothetical protein